MRSITLSNAEWAYDEAKPLGRPGGFGAVFLGRGADGGEVAVKRLTVGAADAHRELDMARELSARELRHVVPMLDWGRDRSEDAFFVVMPVCEGSLAELVEREAPLPLDLARGVVKQIVDGLLEVADIVHRDLKPGNVLRREGRWCVSDFGIAKLAADSTSADTLRDVLSAPYAAPEQWRGERPVAATDVYALGCLIHELINVQPPFVADDRWLYMDMHLHQPAPPLSGGDARLTSFVRRMLAKEPEGRPSLARCREVLVTTGTALAPHSGVLAAAAHLAEERARVEADAARERSREQRRTSLVRDGAAEMLRIFGRFCATMTAMSDDATASDDVLKFGGAVLRRGRIEPVDKQLDRVEVVAWSSLELRQAGASGGNNLLGRFSASLLLARFKPDDPFRWHETGYWSLTDSQDAPFSVSPDSQSFNFVFSNVMSSTSLAYGPIAIDGEDEEEFVRRWLGLLGKAAVAKLYRPGSLPLPAGWFD